MTEMNLFLPPSDNGPGVANGWPVLALGGRKQNPWRYFIFRV